MQIEYAVLLYRVFVVLVGLVIFWGGFKLANRSLALLEQKVELKITGKTIAFSGVGSVAVILASFGVIYAAILKPLRMSFDPMTGALSGVDLLQMEESPLIVFDSVLVADSAFVTDTAPEN